MNFGRSSVGGAGLVVAILALALAITGAAVGLPGRGSVDSGDIKTNAVKSRHLAASALKCPGGMARVGALCYERTANAADDNLAAGYACAQKGRELPTWSELLRIAHSGGFPTGGGELWSSTRWTDTGEVAISVNKIASNNIPTFNRPVANNFKFHCVREATP